MNEKPGKLTVFLTGHRKPHRDPPFPWDGLRAVFDVYFALAKVFLLIVALYGVGRLLLWGWLLLKNP